RFSRDWSSDVCSSDLVSGAVSAKMRRRLMAVARTGRASLPRLDRAGTDAVETLWSAVGGVPPPDAPGAEMYAPPTTDRDRASARRRGRNPDLRGVQLAQLQFAAEQELEGFQVTARLGH